MDHDRRLRYLSVGLGLTALLAVLAVGWLAWIAADPRFWFPDAFAEQGPRGDEGPRGERGPRGPIGLRGETGPGVDDAQSTADEALAGVDDAQTQIDDLSSRVDNLEGVDVYDLESRLSEVEFAGRRGLQPTCLRLGRVRVLETDGAHDAVVAEGEATTPTPPELVAGSSAPGSPPVLAALAAGEGRAEDPVLLEPHMRTCLSCRTRLRALRAP
jgi:hypothetical protein